MPGAKLAVRVTALDIFPNCPRYLPEEDGRTTSVFSPRDDYVPPEPFWKSKPDLRPFVPAAGAPEAMPQTLGTED